MPRMIWLPVERLRCMRSLNIRYSAQSSGNTTSSTRELSLKFTLCIFSKNGGSMAMVLLVSGGAVATDDAEVAVLWTFLKKLVHNVQVLCIGPGRGGLMSSVDSTLKKWTLCRFPEFISEDKLIFIASVFPVLRSIIQTKVLLLLCSQTNFQLLFFWIRTWVFTHSFRIVADIFSRLALLRNQLKIQT